MLDPKKIGAESQLDIVVFLLGGAFGGILDAITSLAGFAEPLVFAGLCGSGALGPKKTIEGARRRDDDRS